MLATYALIAGLTGLLILQIAAQPRDRRNK